MLQLVPFASKPYYAFTVNTNAGTAKFVFVAANAWDATQQSWLQTQLAQQTNYTFVIRHEPLGDTSAPGSSPSDSIIAQYPLTIGFYGHSHEYRHIDANHVIVGNGGAPISYGNYGFAYVVQRTDGNIEVQSIRSDTGAVTDTWAVTPTGAQTQ